MRAGPEARVEVAFEPVDRVLNHGLQCSRLGEEVTGSRDDFQCLGPTEPRERVFVEFDDIIIETARDQQRRRENLIECVAGEIRPSSARDDRLYPTTESCR